MPYPTNELRCPSCGVVQRNPIVPAVDTRMEKVEFTCEYCYYTSRCNCWTVVTTWYEVRLGPQYIQRYSDAEREAFRRENDAKQIDALKLELANGKEKAE